MTQSCDIAIIGAGPSGVQHVFRQDGSGAQRYGDTVHVHRGGGFRPHGEADEGKGDEDFVHGRLRAGKGGIIADSTTAGNGRAGGCPTVS